MSNRSILKKSREVFAYASYLFSFIIAIVFLFPIFMTIATSLKLESEVFTKNFEFIGSTIVWNNYILAWTAFPIGRFLLNSLFIASSIVSLTVITSSLAAYAFARIKFKGRDTIFILYLATIMIPLQVTVIPLYIIMHTIKWVDTYQGLIIPMAFSAFGTFLMRQFFLTIPYELEEAGRIDGCSALGLYSRIIMPLSLPAMAVLAIFTFVNQWKGLFWPLIMTNSPKMKPISVGILSFIGQYGTQWNLLMAAAVISMIPAIILFIALQKYLVEGISVSGFGGI